MSIKKEDAIKRIGRYLRRDDSHPRFINVNNPEDLESITQQFDVGENVFKAVPDFSAPDENLSEDVFFSYLGNANGTVFVTGLTSYYKLLGEQKLRDFINRVIGMSLIGTHLVVVCYQCEKILANIDKRFSQFIYIVEGEEEELPQLVFTPANMPVPMEKTSVKGVENISAAVERGKIHELFVHTGKHKLAYQFSLYTIKEQNNSFEVLCAMDALTKQLKEEYGTMKQWDTALGKISEYRSWMKYISNVFGSCTNLELAAVSWSYFDSQKKWLYFIALKLYGAKNSWCISEAVKFAENSSLLVRGIYRSILTDDINDKQFWEHYDERKNLIKSLGNSDAEVVDYCAMVKSKGEKTLYFLTDTSKAECNLIFETLFAYSDELGREEVMAVLRHVYPALYSYLQPYRFKIPLLDLYFKEYKYQKVVNKISPKFMEIVDAQAEKREFNLLLPARSEKLDKIQKKDTVVCFMDSMGVEYLSYIMDQCRLRKLIAYVTLCRCELPSITLFNKEFVDVFEEGGADFMPDKNGIKSLDDLKHHGEEEFDFTNNALPTYISSELDIIGKIIEKIATKLMNGMYKRAVMISDHGSSRLSVLSKKENKWGTESNAEHSGRCCPVSAIDQKPSCAIEENGYWVLANYDRFKGGRKANVEVHGGATLEEVVVPIIEIVYSPNEIEIQLLDKKIKFSKRKKNAVIRVFSKTKLDNLSVRISGLSGEYEGTSTDGQTFKIALPELRKAGKYTVDVYYNNNPLKSNLKFTAENSDFSEKKLL